MKYTQPRVDHVAQVGYQQCWAACMKMLLDVKRKKAESPKVGGDVVLVGYDAIVSRAMFPKADHPIPDDFFASAFYTFGVAVDVTRGQVSWDDIKTNIDNDRPLIIGVNWHLSGGHVMVVGGYEKDGVQRWVWLHDPGDAEGKKVHFDRLVNGNYEFAGRNASQDEWDLTIAIAGNISPTV